MVSDWCGLLPWSEARAEQPTVKPELVRFTAETEPLLELIEKTPGEECVAVMMEQFRRGLPYGHFLTALYLAAVRAAPYHGSVHGFDHNAYSIYSAHQLSLWLPPQEALLPGFWALASLKRGSVRLARLPIAIKGSLPSSARASAELQNGIENQDEERAIGAIVALVRSQGPQAIAELLWPYAGRDWFFIGHLAILVSNSWRLLQTIGWQHAEPVLRYVVSGLSGMKKGESLLEGFAENRQRAVNAAKNLPPDWAAPTSHPAFTRDLLVLLRDQKALEACKITLTHLASRKVQAGAVWDSVFLAAGEMIMSVQKNSEPLHANTVANALRYAFDQSAVTSTRLLLLLQALKWSCHFRHKLVHKQWLRDAKDITALTPRSVDNEGGEGIREILAGLSRGGREHGVADTSPVPGWHGTHYNSQPWRYEAATKAFALARQGRAANELLRAAARLLPAKADGDPHRIKFPIAMFENCGWISPDWRPHLVAAATYSFLGADAPDTQLIRQVREATTVN